MTTPSRYAVEIRDKDMNLKYRIEDRVTSCNWEWNRIGGCGRATYRVNAPYKSIVLAPDDDIRLYLPNATTGATLWHRGFVDAGSPTLQTGNNGEISIECMGYFGWLDRVIVQDTNAPKVYTNQEVSLIVSDIITSFIAANSDVTLGTVEGGSFVPDTISFKVSARDAIRTLIDLSGAVECGVGPDLAFFWHNPDYTLKHVFYIGDHIVKLVDRMDYKQLLNYIYFEGGDVSGAAFLGQGFSQSSINRYNLHEDVISNGSITSNSVANRYLSNILKQRSAPSRQLSISVKNTIKRLEASLPIGSVSVVDQDDNQVGTIYGDTASGGSNKLYGTISNGGSGQVYGGVARNQVDRIQYTMSPEDGKVHAEIQFGTSLGYSKASATLKQIEQIQNALRQRSL